MSYTSFAVYMQRRTASGPGPGGDCDPYTRPDPLAVVTNLNAALVFQDPEAVVTNLCEEVS